MAPSRIVAVGLALSIGETLAFTAPLTSNMVASPVGRSLRTGDVRAGDDGDEVSDWGVDNLFAMMEDADDKIGGLDAFMTTVKKDPSSIDFEQTMAAIEDGFDYSAVAFKCGELESSAEQNQGSAKILSFGKMKKLKKETTLEVRLPPENTGPC